MSELQSCSLIPEDYLTSGLSPLWQKRFKRAIEYLEQSIDQYPPPLWDDVAAHAAISPFHFHRMFTAVFGEPPGHYLRRIRLQYVVHLLITMPKKPVTDIALDCGFSSSQSMAKALRRELKTSASTIRRSYMKEGWETIEPLWAQLGQPEATSGVSLEESMAEKIQFSVSEHPESYFFVKPVQISESWLDAAVEGLVSVQDLYTFIKTTDVEKPAEQQVYQAGYEVERDQANLVIPAVRCLSCRVRLNSMVAYSAVWDALYLHVLSLGLEPDPQGYATEIIHQNSDWQSEEYEMTFSLGVMGAL